MFGDEDRVEEGRLHESEEIGLGKGRLGLRYWRKNIRSIVSELSGTLCESL